MLEDETHKTNFYARDEYVFSQYFLFLSENARPRLPDMLRGILPFNSPSTCKTMWLIANITPVSQYKLHSLAMIQM